MITSEMLIPLELEWAPIQGLTPEARRLGNYLYELLMGGGRRERQEARELALARPEGRAALAHAIMRMRAVAPGCGDSLRGQISRLCREAEAWTNT